MTALRIWSEEDIRALPRVEREKLNRIAIAHAVPPWSPLPGPQQMAYDSIADIIGYGGAAGGGKTDLALGKMLNQHKRSICFRKNGTEHAAFVDRMEEVLGTREGLNGKDGIWRMTLAHRKTRIQIELGSVPNGGDEKKYRGRPHDFKFFDEAAEIPEYQVRFLLGWLRTTDAQQRCQALLCFNPPTTSDGQWIIEFFAPWLDPKHPCPAQPGEIRYFAMIRGKETEVVDGRSFVINALGEAQYEYPASTKPIDIIKPQSRTFIPAKVTDNPHLVGTHYMNQLQALPEPLRSQMLYGDFRAGMTADPWQVIPTAWVEAAQARWKPKLKVEEMMAVGVDVARGGKDETVIARRHLAMWFDVPLAYPGAETPDGPTVCGLVVACSRDRAPQHVEINGVGGSPYDFLRKAHQPVVGIDVSAASTGTDISGLLTFHNVRTEMWWKMREALDPANNTGIALPPNAKLKADLCTPKWSHEGRKIYVESREDIVARLKRSADYGTAYCLALIETPKLNHIPGAHLRSNEAYDPYRDQGVGARPADNEAYDPYKGL